MRMLQRTDGAVCFLSQRQNYPRRYPNRTVRRTECVDFRRRVMETLVIMYYGPVNVEWCRGWYHQLPAHLIVIMWSRRTTHNAAEFTMSALRYKRHFSHSARVRDSNTGVELRVGAGLRPRHQTQEKGI